MSMVVHTADVSPDLSSMSFEELAELATDEYRLAQKSMDSASEFMTDAVVHAIRAGDALLVMKSKYAGNADWTSWLDENFPPGRFQAEKFMRLAFYQEHLVGVPNVTMHNARFLIQGLPPLPRTTHRFVISKETQSEIRQLVKRGVPKAEVARMMDIHPESVTRLTDPDAARKLKDKKKRYQARRRAEKKALDDKNRVEAAKRAGGSLGKSYSLVRQAAAEIDRAIADADSQEVRSALRAALTGIHRAEDYVGKAIRSS